ncbi:MAG: sigma-70 family RNA polymerase sigma factor [Bacteroidaceae bacterium]|nr:sigma-70 family RNA polymerase sigma factor [Bacteroidaceae bacterium]
MENVSFRTTVLPLSDRLFRIALRITMNRAEAEDVVQDTLLRVWECRGEWEQIGSLEAFAIATCRNRALDVAKRAGRNNASLDKIDSVQPSIYNLQSSIEAREQLSIVRRLMDDLPEVQRTIMLLRDIEGKTYQEIAQLLDISETQVKVYLHRARTKIKERIWIINT